MTEDFDIGRDVCFIGHGTTAVCYYRCMLPAQKLGCDWAGVAGDPPKLAWLTGLTGKQSVMPDLFSYKIVVLQQPAGKGWLEMIEALQSRGVKVVYEVDDYLHGIKSREDHDFRKQFGKDYLARAEAAMKKCDAIICSTEWIQNAYRNFNKRAFLCRNGIDTARYDLTIPERKTVNIGWAGATGHQKVITPWLQMVTQVMMRRENTCFVSIGQPFADAFKPHFGETRCISVPWAAIEQYPAAMTMMDIAPAPGGRSGFFKGKSDLRWLESGALGIPLIAHPDVYPEIKDGVTGFHADNPMAVGDILLRLVADADLRTAVGENAKAYVRRNRSIGVMAQQWGDAFSEIVRL